MGQPVEEALTEALPFTLLRLPQGEGEAEGEPLARALGEPLLLPLGEPLLLPQPEGSPGAVAWPLAVAQPDAAAEGVVERDSVGDAVKLPDVRALPLPAAREAVGLREGGSAVGDVSPPRVGLSRGVTLGEPPPPEGDGDVDGEAVTEGERLAEAHTEGVMVPLPLRVGRWPLAEALREAEGQAVEEADSDACEALAHSLLEGEGEPVAESSGEAVPVGVEEREGVEVGDTEGARDAEGLPEEEREREGEGDVVPLPEGRRDAV